MEILGIAADRFDPALLRATDGLLAAATAAADTQSSRVAPVHLLIATARIPGGLATDLFARQHLPVDVFCQALRPRDPATVTESPPRVLTRETVTPATRRVFAALAATGHDERISERRLLAEVLHHLDPDALALLRDYARVDIATWLEQASSAPVPSWYLYDGSGRLAMNTFTPAAQRVLTTMVAEAGALNRTSMGNALLLYAMAAVPNGVLEQACHFLQHNVQTLRLQFFALVGGRVGTAVTEVPLDTDTIEAPLRLVLEKARASAVSRRRARTAEPDLLAGLLDNPNGLAASFFRDVGLDVERLLHYAVEYYQESSAGSVLSGGPGPSLEAARAELSDRVIGQPAVVERLLPHLELIKRAQRRGYRIDDRPRATFLFCGPSGSGKTMTARVLAMAIYGSEDELVMFEMGQFNGWESINNFIGAPPAYIGFGQGKLTNALRDNPRRVLLFDEVEKADQRVFDALLRLLDEGRISDPAGPVRDARDAVIVLTSNLATSELAALDRSRTDAAHVDRLRQILERFFRPEFLNRIDEVVVFAPFGPAELRSIAQAGLRRQAVQVRAQLGVELTWADEVPVRIADLAAELRRHEAARGVNRCVGTLVVQVLRLLDEAEALGHTVTAAQVTVADGQLTVVETGHA